MSGMVNGFREGMRIRITFSALVIEDHFLIFH